MRVCDRIEGVIMALVNVFEVVESREVLAEPHSPAILELT